MTLKELRKQLRGLDENMEVYIANHDHSEWETDALTCYVRVENQEDYDVDYKKEGQPIINGDYIVITG
tara:strand:- start:147 stop:350 length:204 start_codon:yes stop_codon:yes gene_type:complete